MTYDNEGNIKDKHTTDGILINTYTYGTLGGCASVAGAVAPGPHAVSQAGSVSYCYDRDGNVLRGGSTSTTFSYTPYDLPATLVSASNNSKIGFEYGPNREKVRRLTYPTPTATQALDITHYVGAAEVRYQNTVLTEVRRYVGGAVIVVQGGAAASYAVQRQYLLTDAQGSTFAVLTERGDPVNASAAMSFDPFGLRRDPGKGTSSPWFPSLLQDLDATTHHGYTGQAVRKFYVNAEARARYLLCLNRSAVTPARQPASRPSLGIPGRSCRTWAVRPGAAPCRAFPAEAGFFRELCHATRPCSGFDRSHEDFGLSFFERGRQILRDRLVVREVLRRVKRLDGQSLQRRQLGFRIFISILQCSRHCYSTLDVPFLRGLVAADQ